MEETGCEVIGGAPTTPTVKEQVKGEEVYDVKQFMGKPLVYFQEMMLK